MCAQDGWADTQVRPYGQRTACGRGIPGAPDLPPGGKVPPKRADEGATYGTVPINGIPPALRATPLSQGGLLWGPRVSLAKYPQGVGRIRRAAKPPTAAHRVAWGEADSPCQGEMSRSDREGREEQRNEGAFAVRRKRGRR